MKLNQELEVIIYLNPDGDFKIGGSLMDDGRLADRIGVLEERRRTPKLVPV